MTDEHCEMVSLEAIRFLVVMYRIFCSFFVISVGSRSILYWSPRTRKLKLLFWMMMDEGEGGCSLVAFRGYGL